MIVERFRNGDATAVGERFKLMGRMLPDGLVYKQSWIDLDGTRCFQIIETVQPELLTLWIEKWEDLVDFEVIPVQNSSDFWDSRA
ncbi:MAG TPA: DUF3303 family protein [Blastocatellia bacterium]|nr:DUF3303 family protein [Blastocatellia bacterium]